MTHQNRVTPLGELIAAPERGLVYGNRGCLHDPGGRIRRRRLLQPGRYTELFFLDEATAWAAGHRPCAECRYADWRRFGDLWSSTIDPDRRADAIDARLHAERVGPSGEGHGRARLHRAESADLPDGVFVLFDGEPHVVVADRVLRWSPGGYRDPGARPTGELDVITPPSLVAVLRAGWATELTWLHPSAVRT